MPKNQPTPKLNLRISFESANEKEIGNWESHLIENGVKVLGRSKRALDIEGTQDVLQETLNISISVDKDKILIEDSAQSETFGASPRPHIYAPRRPTLF